MARLSPEDARGILARCLCAVASDFHALPADKVERLQAEADCYGYRKPKNANGSRLRYFHAHLVRRATAKECE